METEAPSPVPEEEAPPETPPDAPEGAEPSEGVSAETPGEPTAEATPAEPEPTYQLESWSGLARYVCLLCGYGHFMQQAFAQHMLAEHDGVMIQGPTVKAGTTEVTEDQPIEAIFPPGTAATPVDLTPPPSDPSAPVVEEPVEVSDADAPASASPLPLETPSSPPPEALEDEATAPSSRNDERA